MLQQKDMSDKMKLVNVERQQMVLQTGLWELMKNQELCDVCLVVGKENMFYGLSML